MRVRLWCALQRLRWWRTGKHKRKRERSFFASYQQRCHETACDSEALFAILRRTVVLDEHVEVFAEVLETGQRCLA